MGFVVAAIALAVVGVASYRSIARLTEDQRWVTHSHKVQTELARVERELLAAESSVRGYTLTANPEFVQSFEESASEARTRLESVIALTSDNPHQQDRLRPTVGVLKERFAKLQEQIEFRRNTDPTLGVDFKQGQALASAGRALTTDFLDTLHAADEEEAELLKTRDEASRETIESTRIVIIGGSLAAVILSILIGWWTATSVGRQIGSAIQTMQSSSTELQAAANQQASSATEQASAMSEIATTISELLATSRQIAESSQRVSQIASQTAGTARSGDTTVARTQDTQTQLRKQVDQIVNHMLDLGKRSQQIGGVLDLVGELAEQTNILAINASIEAAGAGDSGRRFGVVADEIRKLADRVTQSTKEIRTLIDDVRGAVNTTVMATETGSKAVDAGATQIVEMAASFKQIAGMVTTTMDAAREIELSTKQQATAVEQVNVAISNIAQASRETEASATQTLQTSGRITELSKDLLRIVESSAS
ncbi:MAG TPA: methyl-accepting chemotaxis protein [Kofleriaceae bacterium]